MSTKKQIMRNYFLEASYLIKDKQNINQNSWTSINKSIPKKKKKQAQIICLQENENQNNKQTIRQSSQNC